MNVQVKKIEGSWDLGFVLHKHTISSVYLGEDERGRARFDTTRSEPGEALYRLKYQKDWSQVEPLAAQVQATLLPLFQAVGLVIPMPASTARPKQPVNELARALGRLAGVPVFESMVVKASSPPDSIPLKDLRTRAEKDAALAGRISINECISNEGCWNVTGNPEAFFSAE